MRLVIAEDVSPHDLLCLDICWGVRFMVCLSGRRPTGKKVGLLAKQMGITEEKGEKESERNDSWVK